MTGVITKIIIFFFNFLMFIKVETDQAPKVSKGSMVPQSIKGLNPPCDDCDGTERSPNEPGEEGGGREGWGHETDALPVLRVAFP